MDPADTELFIDLVKKYPELWNVGCEDYKNRGKKDAAWLAVALATTTGFQEMLEEEKKKIVKTTISKWKNIKDAYMKSERMKTQSGQPAQKRRVYIYAKQLSFLQTSAALAETQSTLTGNNTQSDVDEPEQSPIEAPLPPRALTTTQERCVTPQQRKAKRRDLEGALLSYMTQPEVVDADRSFFDSLLPIVHQFSDPLKLQYRSDILQITTRYHSLHQGSHSSAPFVPPPTSFQQPTVGHHHHTFGSTFSEIHHPPTQTPSTINSPSVSAPSSTRSSLLHDPTSPHYDSEYGDDQ